jgi:ABC-type transport system involved in multi-copper enzyme maturation permease subunit
MTFFAMLKDSLREAIDTWVFYVTVALSALLILGIGSVSFTPRPAADVIKPASLFLNDDTNRMLEEFKAQMAAGRPPNRVAGPRFPFLGNSFVTYEIKGVEPLDNAPDRPQSPLVFTVRAQYVRLEQAARASEDPAPTFETLGKRLASMGERQFLDVTEVRLARPDNHFLPEKPDPKQVYFEILTRPNRNTLVVWPHDTSLAFGAIPLKFPEPFPLGMQLLLIEEIFVNSIGATVALLVSIIITAFFIPNMLRKGTVDMLLVKPVHRTTLLLYKYVGGLTFIFLNATVAVGGTWLVLGLRSGYWANSFLLTIPILTFAFAVLYAVATLFAVLTRSAVISILISGLFWILLFVVSQAAQFFEQEEKIAKLTNSEQAKMLSEGWWVPAVEGVHYLLPRYRDLVVLSSNRFSREMLPQAEILQRELETEVRWQESLAVSGAWIALMLGLACWRFATRDY